MSGFSANYLTLKGIALQSKAQTGVQLQFTRIGIGDGVLPDGQALRDLTALLHEKISVPIQELEVVGNGTSRLNFLLTNKDRTEGVFIREIGIFAMDPDEGEILYAITYAGDKYDYLPPDGEATAVSQDVDIYTIIGNAPNVTAVFAQVAAIDVDVKQHLVEAATANGQTDFILPWPYNPRRPNLAVYRDGVKQIRGIHWDPPPAEAEAETSTTVIFKAPLAGLVDGLEFFSIPVAAGTHKVATVWHKAADYTITNGNNGHVLTNRDCTTAMIFTLDSMISVGMRVTVAKLAAYDVTVQAPAGESIIDSIAGGYIQNIDDSQVGATLSLIKVSDTLWTVERGFGTWSTNNGE